METSGRFSQCNHKIGQKRIRKSCTCHHRTILIYQNATHLKKSINQARLEIGTYDQIVTHLEKELELNGSEAPDELQKNTASQQPTNTNADRLKPTCHHCKKNQSTRKVSVACWQNSENNLKSFKIFLETKNDDANNSNPYSNINNNIKNNNHKISNRAERKP